MTPAPGFTPKSFLQRPEGKLGIILPVLGGVGLIALLGWQTLMDYIFGAIANGVELALIIGGLFLLFLARKPIYYFYRSFCRFMTGLIIEIDPIGILKTYREKLNSKLDEMKKSIDLLQGQKVKVERIIQKNNNDIDHSMGLVAQAVKAGDARIQSLEGRQATRLQQENERISVDYNRIMFLITVLNRYYQLSQDQITDMGREIESKERERAYSQASQKAIRGATGILKGLPGDKEMYDQSLELLEEQYSNAVGEVEHFLDMTKDIISTSDMQNGADADKALKMLDEWQKKNSGIKIGNSETGVTKATIIQDAQKALTAAPTGIKINTGKIQYQTAPVQNTSGGDDEYLKLMK